MPKKKKWSATPPPTTNRAGLVDALADCARTEERFRLALQRILGAHSLATAQELAREALDQRQHPR